MRKLQHEVEQQFKLVTNEQHELKNYAHWLQNRMRVILRSWKLTTPVLLGSALISRLSLKKIRVRKRAGYKKPPTKATQLRRLLKIVLPIIL